jgi:hypothetical protein
MASLKPREYFSSWLIVLCALMFKRRQEIVEASIHPRQTTCVGTGPLSACFLAFTTVPFSKDLAGMKSGHKDTALNSVGALTLTNVVQNCAKLKTI